VLLEFQSKVIFFAGYVNNRINSLYDMFLYATEVEAENRQMNLVRSENAKLRGHLLDANKKTCLLQKPHQHITTVGSLPIHQSLFHCRCMDGKVNSLLIPSDGIDFQFLADNDVSSRPSNHAGHSK